MDHDLVLDGWSYRLRPVTVGDAGFIHALRSGERGRFLHAQQGDVADQVRWTEAYLRRPGDYYFVVEDVADATPEGTVAIYDVQGTSAEWGRWVLRDGSLAAIESALLVYRCGFDILGLDELYCRTMAANQAVVSFHTSFGLVTAGDELVDGIPHVRQHLTAAQWPPCRDRAAALARRLAERRAPAVP
jgi:RimJ/RimL family protein N-acetyltransferase